MCIDLILSHLNSVRTVWHYVCVVVASAAAVYLFFFIFSLSLTHSHANDSPYRTLAIRIAADRVRIHSFSIHADAVHTAFSMVWRVCLFVALFCFALLRSNSWNTNVLTQPGALTNVRTKTENHRRPFYVHSNVVRYDEFHSEWVRANTQSLNSAIVVTLYRFRRERWREEEEKTHTQNLILCFGFLLLTFDLQWNRRCVPANVRQRKQSRTQTLVSVSLFSP